MPHLFLSSKSTRNPKSNQELKVIWRIAIDLDRLSRLGEGASVVARRDNVLRQVAALEVNINRSRKWKRTKEKEGEMGPKKGKDGGGGGGKGDKGQSVCELLQSCCILRGHYQSKSKLPP